MSDGVRAMWMRGGTSKGGYFLAEDLPASVVDRDVFLLRAMGSPDSRQIDGMGGADPLTSKVAVVKRSSRQCVDVDYLFLQVFVDEPIVSDSQNCGNILAGVGPFAIERGLVAAKAEKTDVRIFMENTGQIATTTVSTPGGAVEYEGTSRIDGVPGAAAAMPIAFEDTAGSTCGALLPTGNAADRVAGHDVTLIDNGMPCVILRAADFDVSGTEAPEALDADTALTRKIEEIRLWTGPMMNLGDVTNKSVPKMTLVSPPSHGAISTRTFIPHRCHKAIGVFGAVTVGSACLLSAGPAAELARLPEGNPKALSIEHPTGEFTVVVNLDESGNIVGTGVLRTARKLFDGIVFG